MSDTEYAQFWTMDFFERLGLDGDDYFWEQNSIFILTPKLLEQVIPDPRGPRSNRFVDFVLSVKDRDIYYDWEAGEFVRFEVATHVLKQELKEQMDDITSRYEADLKRNEMDHEKQYDEIRARYRFWYQRRKRRFELGSISISLMWSNLNLSEKLSQSKDSIKLNYDAMNKPHIDTYRTNMAKVLAQIMDITPST